MFFVKGIQKELLHFGVDCRGLRYPLSRLFDILILEGNQVSWEEGENEPTWAICHPIKTNLNLPFYVY